MIFKPIRVLVRPKKNGLGTHFGVEFPSGEVFDYTYEQGLRRLSRLNFADGASVEVVREIPWHQGPIVRARLEELARNPRTYDLLNWNCETFAEWLTSGVPKSAQVIGGLLLIGIVLVLAVAIRS
jgi:hypothetical protein